MLPLLLLSLLPACAEKGSEVDAVPAPTPGWYELEIAPAADWSCAGAAPHSDEAARTSSLAELSFAEGEPALTWRWADAADPLACDFDGLDFRCEVYASTRTDGVAPADSAEVHDDRWIEGEWTADGHIDGAQVRALDCEGEDCDGAASAYGDGFVFPCEGWHGFAATLVEG